MKNCSTKRIFLIGFISITIFSAFLTPVTKAQTWTYNGADTTKIQDFSVYPSEWYIYNNTWFPERYDAWEISHGNVSDLGLGKGNTMWINSYKKNKTSGELEFKGNLYSSWNSSIGYQGTSSIIPVGNDGKVSQSILNSVSSFALGNWEHNKTNINYYSISFWNTTINDWFTQVNYTEEGILIGLERYMSISLPNITLVSFPARIAPDFSFDTEDSILNISISSIKLKMNVTSADNNNDGEIDTDYLYRIFENGTWSSWIAIPALIDYDLGSVPSGNYDILVEVKNMYGETQKQITIEYTAPSGDVAIPGYSTLLIAITMFLGISFILFRSQKKLC